MDGVQVDGLEKVCPPRFEAAGQIAVGQPQHDPGKHPAAQADHPSYGTPARDGARIVEVPITFEERREGTSKMSKAIFFEAFKVVLALRWAATRGQVPVVKPSRL